MIATVQLLQEEISGKCIPKKMEDNLKYSTTFCSSSNTQHFSFFFFLQQIGVFRMINMVTTYNFLLNLSTNFEIKICH